jgi:hypothetical protein
MMQLRTTLAALLLASGLCLAAPPEPAAVPQVRVDTTMPAPTSNSTVQVKAGDSFQAALDKARPGDVIELEAGAEFRGPFTLPRKSGDGWIVIRSSAASRLPAEDTRVQAGQEALMPTLVSADGNVISTAPGAHHFRFIGIEIRPSAGSFLYNLVELGSGNEQQQDLPHHIVFDRCYLHGDPTAGARRGIAMNSAHTAVINSWLGDFKEVGADSQAVAGWNGPGPFLIANNHLEAAGENVMFGGGTPAIEGLVPADIEIRGNYFTKSLSWKADDASYAGTAWSVKNLFELKNARRVLVEGNVFEHNWPAAQNGFAVLLTVRNEGGTAPWATVEDVTFRNNLLSGIASGFNILGHDDNGEPSGQTRRIVISNNLFSDLGGDWGKGTWLQLLDGIGDLTIEHNTVLNTGTIAFSEGRPHTNVRLSDNIVRHNEYGIAGSGTSSGKQTLEQYFHGGTLERNLIVGGKPRDYPESNFFAVADTDVGFRDLAAGDFRLDPARSARRGETNAAGADFDALCAALAPADRGRHCTGANAPN